MTVLASRDRATRTPVEPVFTGGETLQLLVSVQNAAEAAAAVAGGADVIDVKQPARGSLGMASPENIQGVAEYLQRSGCERPLSVALGEIGDWRDGGEIPQLPQSATFVKMGLTGAASTTSWESQWLALRERFEEATARSLNWVAVIYADGEKHGCPPANEIIRAAAESGCCGVLFDTFDKSTGNVFHHLTAVRLKSLMDSARQRGLFVALAGRISERDLPGAANLPVDVVAVRSAVCENGLRERPVSRRRVSELRSVLDAIGLATDRRVESACRRIRDEWARAPEVGFVLGTGCGRLIDDIDAEAAFPYESLPHFPTSTAMGHAGRLICGRYGDVPVVAMDGRVHAYEGYSIDDVTLPVRVMRRLGVQLLIITNASGGLNHRLDVGDIVLVEDCINLIGGVFSRSANVSPAVSGRSGRRPVFDARRHQAAVSAAKRCGVPLERGTYVAVTGPNYETRAEYRFYRQLGGDVIGMSTAPELAVAKDLGLECLAFSIVTNSCNPDAPSETDGAAVVSAARRSSGQLRSLIAAFMESCEVRGRCIRPSRDEDAE